MKVIPEPNQDYGEALTSSERFVPPAVWLPYNKMGRSATDVQVIDQDGKFGPFDGQFLIGEFTNSAVNRVFLEEVDGQYQGACFPFLNHFPAAVLRLQFAPDGSLFVGMSNRGWSSLGNRSYGLQRITFNQKTPFAIKEMKAQPEGFELIFTEPLHPDSLTPESLKVSSFTYQYSSRYGGDEINPARHKISGIKTSKGGRSVRFKVENLRTNYVFELTTQGLRSKLGQRLKHPQVWYTLNRIRATSIANLVTLIIDSRPTAVLYLPKGPHKFVPSPPSTGRYRSGSCSGFHQSPRHGRKSGRGSHLDGEVPKKKWAPDLDEQAIQWSGAIGKLLHASSHQLGLRQPKIRQRSVFRTIEDAACLDPAIG
jgi:hypothetical protein